MNPLTLGAVNALSVTDLTAGFLRESAIKSKEKKMKYWIAYKNGLYVIEDDEGKTMYSSYSKAATELRYQELAHQ